MQLHWWQTQFLRDICVLQCSSLIQCFSLDPLRCEWARRWNWYTTKWTSSDHLVINHQKPTNRTATSKCFKFSIDNLSILVDFDLKFHHVTASWSTYQSSANIALVLVQWADIAWILIVIQDLEWSDLIRYISTISISSQFHLLMIECRWNALNSTNFEQLSNTA